MTKLSEFALFSLATLLVTYFPAIVLGAPMENDGSPHNHPEYFYANPYYAPPSARELLLFPLHPHDTGLGSDSHWDHIGTQNLANSHQHNPAHSPYDYSSFAHSGPAHHEHHHGNTDFNENMTQYGMYTGQGSEAPETPDITSVYHEPIPYAQREERPRAELMNRSMRLHGYFWQLKYSQSELLEIYSKIANLWGILPTEKLMALHTQVNEYLEAHPNDIDHILAPNSHEFVSRLISNNFRPTWTDDPSQTDIMTLQQYLDWIVAVKP